MLVSTFELLVKPQLPKNLLDQSGLPPELERLKKLSRVVIQGYFLTIANPNPHSVKISLVFTSVPPVDIDGTVIFVDIDGNEQPQRLIKEAATNKAGYTFDIPADETALFLLQPDFISNPKIIDDANFEIRGYVEIYVSRLSKIKKSVSLLLTPEHRGTFFDSLDDNSNTKLDQIAYSLPTATGSSLFKLT